MSKKELVERKSLYNNIKFEYEDKYKDSVGKLKSFLSQTTKVNNYHIVEREINQELFYYILEPILTEISENGLFGVKNDIFYLYRYDWGDLTDDTNTLTFPNFYHKPSGLRIAWYKYPLRGAVSNMKVTPKKLRAVLYDCLDSWESKEGLQISHLSDGEKWWLKQPRNNKRGDKDA